MVCFCIHQRVLTVVLTVVLTECWLSVDCNNAQHSLGSHQVSTNCQKRLQRDLRATKQNSQRGPWAAKATENIYGSARCGKALETYWPRSTPCDHSDDSVCNLWEPMIEGLYNCTTKYFLSSRLGMLALWLTGIHTKLACEVKQKEYISRTKTACFPVCVRWWCRLY